MIHLSSVTIKYKINLKSKQKKGNCNNIDTQFEMFNFLALFYLFLIKLESSTFNFETLTKYVSTINKNEIITLHNNLYSYISINAI